MKRTQMAQRIALLASCGLMTLIWLVAWIYNIVISIEDFLAGQTRFHSGSPLAWYEYTAIDQTTASPFMLVLTFAVPLVVWAYPKVFPGREQPNWLAAGYTAAFYRFVLYLGLAATLAGMIVALLAVAFENKGDGDNALAQLVAGSATALVSSLIALVAAFFGYVLQLGMKRTGLIADPEQKGWDAEVERLLGGFSDLRNGLAGLFQAVRALHAAVTRVGGQFATISKVFDEIRLCLRKLVGESAQTKGHIAQLVQAEREVLNLLGEQVASQRELLKSQTEQLTSLREMFKGQADQVIAQQKQMLQIQSGLRDLTAQLVESSKTTAELAEQEHDAAESERVANQRAAHVYSSTIVPNPRNNGHRAAALTA